MKRFFYKTFVFFIITTMGTLITHVSGQEDEGRDTLDRAQRMLKNGHSYLDIALELRNKQLFFSSASYLKGHLVSIKKNSDVPIEEQRKIEALMRYHIQTIGPSTFKMMPPHIIQRISFSPSINYIRAIQLFENDQYEDAAPLLKSIQNGHPLSAEARYMAGVSAQLNDTSDTAKDEYLECIKVANEHSEKSKRTEQKRYYTVLKEKCIMNIARIYFENYEYQKSIDLYDQIPKTSYRWPYTLLEKAWAYYHLEDYNRSLGLLVSYKSPLLTSYFFPESEVLRALNYHSLCLWNDTEKIIHQYYNVYHQKSQNLAAILTSNNNTDNFFLRLITTDISQNEQRNMFIRNLMTQIRKQIKYNIELVSYRRGLAELQQLQSLPESEIKSMLTDEVRTHLRVRANYLNHYVKEKMYGFINEIHRHSYEMFNIRLEVMGRQRNLLYDNQELISDRSRGSFENVQRKGNEHFFDFRGEFWADELGDYSFGLKSNCETVTVAQARKRRGEK